MRRLPVVQNTDDEASRPSWHYLLIGAGFTITLWLPLAMLGLWLGSLLALAMFDAGDSEALQQALQSASESRKKWAAVVQALPLLLSFFIACFASAVLVGRFGGRAGRREAILGNLIASAVVLLLAAAAGGLSAIVAFASLAVLVFTSGFAGWAGARLGKKLRIMEETGR